MKQANKKTSKKNTKGSSKKSNKKKITKKTNNKKVTKNNKQVNKKVNVNEKKNNKQTNKKNVVEKKKSLTNKSIKEDIKQLKEKKKININLSVKARKRLIKISIGCLVVAILLMLPFGITKYKSEASGKILDIPKFSKLSEECCMYSATFTSMRSYSSLKIELERIMKNYEKLNCDGKEYYYNKDENYTITEYGVKRGLIFNSFYITYGNGNSCEIDTTLKNLELLADDYSIADAKKDGVYVIDGDKVYNSSSYDKFLTNVEQKIPSTLRIAKTTKEGDLILIDLKYLSDGKFKVIYDGTRDRLDKENDSVMIAYVYENIGVYKNKFYAYNGKKLTKSLTKTDDAYYLFDIK